MRVYRLALLGQLAFSREQLPPPADGVSNSVTFDQLSALENVTRLQLLPPIDGTDFNAEHILVSVLGLKIAHAFRLLDPRVPHHRILEVVPSDVQVRLSTLNDGSGILLYRLVHTIDLASDRNTRCCLLVLVGIEHLVDIRHTTQSVDLST